MEEIRIDKMMEILELPMDPIYKLFQSKSPEEQKIILANLKALVLDQKKKLLLKYRPQPGEFILGSSEAKIKEINNIVDFIMQLQVAPTPKDLMFMKV